MTQNTKFHDYVEFVAITVFSLVAATVWVSVLRTVLKKYTSNSLTVEVFTATLVTVVGVLILNSIYGKNKP